jgi:predicted N-formylglutamate amidohydrolase
VLASHRGYDPGTLELGRKLAKATGAPLVACQTSRLLVEPNRSLGHSAIFSEFTRGLDPVEKQRLLDRYYFPHRNQVEEACALAIANGFRCLHLSVHSFTPVLNGETRRGDVGLLFDPAREEELAFAKAWQQRLRAADPSLVVRRNYPYLGKADGLTTALRRKFVTQYLGLELEVNQRWPLGDQKAWKNMMKVIAGTLMVSVSTGP